MKRIDYTQQGGMPLSQDRSAEMQSTYLDAIDAITGILGTNVIVSGCTEANNIIAQGWVLLNGELLPFKGSEKAQYVKKNEKVSTVLTYHDGSQKNAVFEKELIFTNDPTGAVLWSNFTQLGTLQDAHDEIKTRVPQERTVNGYSLENNIILKSSDVGALDASSGENLMTPQFIVNEIEQGKTVVLQRNNGIVIDSKDFVLGIVRETGFVVCINSTFRIWSSFLDGKIYNFLSKKAFIFYAIQRVNGQPLSIYTAIIDENGLYVDVIN